MYGKGDTAKKIVDKIIELKKINVQKKLDINVCISNYTCKSRIKIN